MPLRTIDQAPGVSLCVQTAKVGVIQSTKRPRMAEEIFSLPLILSQQHHELESTEPDIDQRHALYGLIWASVKRETDEDSKTAEDEQQNPQGFLL